MLRASFLWLLLSLFCLVSFAEETNFWRATSMYQKQIRTELATISRKSNETNRVQQLSQDFAQSVKLRKQMETLAKKWRRAKREKERQRILEEKENIKNEFKFLERNYPLAEQEEERIANESGNAVLSCEKELEEYPNKCVIGGPEKPMLHCQMREPNLIDDRGHLNRYLANKEKPYCKPATSIEHLKDIYENLNEKNTIKRSCIVSSMKRLVKIAAPSRKTCNSNTEVPSNHTYWPVSRNEKIRTDLCVTNDVVDYLHFTVNDTLKCVNAINDKLFEEGKLKNKLPPIDAATIFSKINNESAFGFFLQSQAGIGLTQLTSVAAEEMGQGHSGSIYQEAAKGISECSNLDGLLESNLDFTSRGDVRHCQIMGLGEGLARNAFYGFALFSHNRNSHGTNVYEKLEKRGFDLNSGDQAEKTKILNLISLVPFGRYGNAEIEGVLDYIEERIKNGSVPAKEQKAKKVTPPRDRVLSDIRNELVKISKALPEAKGRYREDLIKINQALVDRFAKVRKEKEEIKKRSNHLESLLKEHAGEAKQGRSKEEILKQMLEVSLLKQEKQLMDRLRLFTNFYEANGEQSEEEWQSGIEAIMKEVANSANDPGVAQKSRREIQEAINRLGETFQFPNQDREEILQWLGNEVHHLNEITSFWKISNSQIKKLLEEYENPNISSRTREEVTKEIKEFWEKAHPVEDFDPSVRSIDDLSYKQALSLLYDRNPYIKETMQKMCEMYTYREDPEMNIGSSSNCHNKEFLFSLDVEQLMGEKCTY